jgi:hypothetical protein
VIANWFPQVGVLDDDGWHCHQVRRDTTAFNEFGRYDVRLTTPSGWAIGATGADAGSTTNRDGTTTHRYTADGVQDFAWATSPDFVERTDRIARGARPDLPLRLLLQPEHAEQADRQFAAVRGAILTYERYVGAFPWAQLTIVDPAAVINPGAQGPGVSAAAYPMLLVGGTRWLTPWAAAVPEMALTNQIGRMYFAVDMAPDTSRYHWLDAGLATFALRRALPRAFPQRFVTVDRYFGGLVAWPYPDVAWEPPLDDPPAARWLETLAAQVGDDAMTRGLAAYYAAGTRTHPDPLMFLAAIRTATRSDVEWFTRAITTPDRTVDYAVSPVLSTPTDAGNIDTSVLVNRVSEDAVPVDIRVTFADGADVIERWDGRDASRLFTYRRGTPAVAVDIDPSQSLKVERRRANNSWVARPAGARAADRWSLRWMLWFQHVLMTYAFFV